MTRLLPYLLLTAALAWQAALAQDLTGGAVQDVPGYLHFNVDRIEVETAGLARASATLAQSIDRLADAIAQLSSNADTLSEQQKQTLMNAVEGVDQASRALTELARQLPQTAHELTDKLPQVISDSRQPIAEISGGLQLARDGVYAITEALPEATANAKQLVNSTLDAALLRLSIYSILLLAALALVVIGVIWFVYRQYLDPLAQKLDALTGAPEHFASMASHMQQTSANLLELHNEIRIESAAAAAAETAQIAAADAPADEAAPAPDDPQADAERE